jgi:hypothetical protein
MSELERELTLIASEFRYPPTPRLAQAVSERLAASGPARVPGWRSSPRRGLAIAIAIALLLAGGAVAAVPTTRHAVLDLVGLRGATVERVTTAPKAPVPPKLGVGGRTSLADARRSLGFRPLVPAKLGRPDAVFVRRPPPGGELSLVYAPRPGLPRTRLTGVGLLLGEFRGDLKPKLLGKVVGPGTRVERIVLDGHRAVWIAGAPHEAFYHAPNGQIRPGTVRLAANVLLLNRGKRLVRLEGRFGRHTGIAIARSLRTTRPEGSSSAGRLAP